MSPTGRIISSRINYQTNLDYNNVADKKFYSDACESGKRNLATVAVKLCSPDRYSYNNLVHKNLHSPKINGNNGNSFSKFITSSNDKKPSESVLTELIDSHYTSNSPNRKKNLTDISKSGRKDKTN